MAEKVSYLQVNKIQKTYKAFLKRLRTESAAESRYVENIRRLSLAVAENDARKILKSIPIEEINRGENRFRVKTLREAGITNIADLCDRPENKLSAVYGIGPDSAHLLKLLAGAMADETLKSTKIRLNADHKTPETTALVNELSAYRRSRNFFSIVREGIKEIVPLEEQLQLMKPASSPVRWLLTSAPKKQQALQAIHYLERFSHSAKVEKIRDALEMLENIAATKEDLGWKDFLAFSAEIYYELEAIAPDRIGGSDAFYGLSEKLALKIKEQPLFLEGLKCDLRRYQEWGVKYILHQREVLLGDEMGLGKTVQAIASMVSLKNTGAKHFLVVCPASVLTNWCREIEGKSTLSVTRIHGAGKEAALYDWMLHGGVAVTTYETTAIIQLDKDFSIDLLIVDEAHYIKNPRAKRTIHVCSIAEHADRKLFMTGTALENRVEEMITLIHMLQPDIAARVKNFTYLASAPQFREMVAPVYYRRKREDVLQELPDLIENREWCSLMPQERVRYETSVYARDFMDMRRVSWNGGMGKDGSKAARLLEIIEEAKADGRKVIVFSFFLDTIEIVRNLVGEEALPAITGSVSPSKRQEILDKFESAPEGTVLPAQIQSGGTGLNIQAASVVVICEPQLKPSIENQAISRAYRMGQARNVLVYRLLCENSVDEEILHLLEEKQQVFDAFADKSVAAGDTVVIDSATIKEIIDREIERVEENKNDKIERK